VVSGKMTGTGSCASSHRLIVQKQDQGIAISKLLKSARAETYDSERERKEPGEDHQPAGDAGSGWASIRTDPGSGRGR
jgi:hypothetical protein